MLKLKFIEDFQFNTFWTLENFQTFKNKSYDDLEVLPKITYKFNVFFYLEHDYTKNFTEPTFFPVFMKNGNQPEQLKTFTQYILDNSELFKNKKLIPIVMDPLEGHVFLPYYVEDMAITVRDICTIYYIDGNYRNNELTKVKFYYSYMWLYKVADRIEQMKLYFNYDNTIVNLTEDHKIFICLNRIARDHRAKLLTSFLKHDVRKHGYISWTGEPWKDKIERDYPEVANETWDILDVKNIYEENPTDVYPTEFCKKTFLFVNTETNFDNKTMFLSEKAFKPMVLGMPFILLGNPGVLVFLKSLGFKTFDKWIDESYDNDIEIDKRCEIITKEIVRFANMSSKERIELRHEMHEVTQHNIKNLNKLSQTIDMYEILEKIKDDALSNN